MPEVLSLSPSLNEQLKGGTDCVSGVALKVVQASDVMMVSVKDAVDQLDQMHLDDPTALHPPTQTHRTNDEDFAEFRRAETVREEIILEATSNPVGCSAHINSVACDKATLAGNETSTEVDSTKRFVMPKDFDLLKVIGMGAFGKVLQVRNKHSQTIHAMKVISKRLLRRKTGYIENILTEQAIMARVRHPFVVTMQCSFQTRDKLFLVMDFLAGGELFLRLGREGIFREKTAAFYLAEIILALDHLHGLGILHRDLKPENILLGADGHVCLTDFGLAKDFGAGLNDDEEQQRASTICGTQEYMAPEMIARKGYGRAADYWSLGCIAYEMLNGLPPFDSKQGAKELFRKIMSEKVKMPNLATAAACKLLKGLLNRDVQKRWGTTKNTMFEVGGVTFLKQAEFFKGIDWTMLERKEIEPPVILSVNDEEDLQHFHNEFTSMALPRSVVEMSCDSYRPHRVNSETFRGFSFIQSDYTIPDRDLAEIQKYFSSVEEDGQSVSECASSKLDHKEAPVPAVPEVKKRPPRKRKKKVVGSTDNTPAASAATSPMASATATPIPSENGDALADKLSPVVHSDITASEAHPFPGPTVPVESKSSVPINSSHAPSALPIPEPQLGTQRGTDSARQTARAPTVRGNSTLAVDAQETLHQRCNTRLTANKPHGAEEAANRAVWNRVPAKAASAALRKSSPSSYHSSHGLPQPSSHSGPHMPHNTSSQSVWNLDPSRSSTSSDSQAHVLPPSSDWRQHTMSPHSPRSIRRPKDIDLDAPLWPSLSSDPPLPSSKPAQAKPNLHGAWAARSKR